MPYLRPLFFAGSYLAISVLCGLYYCSVSPSPDQSIFDYIAWQGLHGIQWYVGSFDFTWPGSLVIHETGIRLLGVHRWTARLTDFFLLQLAILSMYLFLRSAGLKAAAVGTALAYPIIYVTSGAWMAGHRDIVAMHVLICSATILVAYRGNDRLKFFLAGFAIGYAVMIRPTYLSFLPFAFVAVFFDKGRSNVKLAFTMIAALGTGVLVFPTIFLIAGFITGTFNAWLTDTRFVFNVYPAPLPRYRLFYGFLEDLRIYFAWLAVAGTASAIFWLTTSSARRHAMLLFGMTLTSVISFVAQNKGFGYHLGGLIPVFTMSALGGIELAFESKEYRLTVLTVLRAMAVAILCVFAIGLERRTQNNLVPYVRSVAVTGEWAPDDIEATTEQAVSIVSRESNPHDYFFQWGWNYDVGFRSQRLAASRYLNTPAFSLIRSDDATYRSWLETFDRDLSEKRPLFVLLDLTTIPKETKIEDRNIQLPPDEASPGLAILIHHLNEDYTVRFRWKDKVLFKRTAT